ncbi:hypothetical protein [Wenjunlia tyrosinilytica]|nr:hypothetical protein [Wenjunlia tyrosinilytica]
MEHTWDQPAHPSAADYSDPSPLEDHQLPEVAALREQGWELATEERLFGFLPHVWAEAAPHMGPRPVHPLHPRVPDPASRRTRG